MFLKIAMILCTDCLRVIVNPLLKAKPVYLRQLLVKQWAMEDLSCFFALPFSCVSSVRRPISFPQWAIQQA